MNFDNEKDIIWLKTNNRISLIVFGLYYEVVKNICFYRNTEISYDIFKKILSNKYNISIPEQRLTAKIANRMIVTLTNEFPLSFFFIRANSIIYLERIISVNKTEQINNKILKKKNPRRTNLSPR